MDAISKTFDKYIGLYFLFPIASCCFGIITIATTLGISQSLHHDTGGLTLPYISDTGRDEPEREVFAVGLSIAAVFLMFTAAINWIILLRRGIEEHPHDRRMNVAGNLFGIIAGVFLVLLSCLNDRDFPDAHTYCAIIFFVCGLIFLVLNMVIYTRLWVLQKTKSSKISMLWKLVDGGIFAVFFLVYIPIGLGILCENAFDLDPTTGIYSYRLFKCLFF
eukprot:TRINITY_DN7977_c0_g1_i1.p1 TRINITY_DN7977_c0_g1~~TRINITY_DN7977_c0_g1_i1.p1  ORF type:complete len:219 (-),score=25.43 TRINITY_DN7977_c0_g1_i1:249-905(-)